MLIFRQTEKSLRTLSFRLLLGGSASPVNERGWEGERGPQDLCM